jgi:hypothetical protein
MIKPLVYVVLEEFSVDTIYTASGLTSGLLYTFKVEARNEFGWGDASESVTILCADKPDTPA